MSDFDERFVQLSYDWPITTNDRVVLKALVTGPKSRDELARVMHRKGRLYSSYGVHAVRMAVSRLRRRLEPYGFTIVNLHGGGFREALYSLEKL